MIPKVQTTGSSWTWFLFGAYLVVTAFLAWRAGRRTTGTDSFAIGSGRMNPWMAGVTLGACMASSSLFVIMPGWVWSDGLPALLGYTFPLIAGFAVGMWLWTPRFQAFGQKKVLTVPEWLGERYGSMGLRRLFAGLGALQVTYLVLVVVGCANAMKVALGLDYQLSVVFVVVFVFAYTGVGGAWAHAFTNSMQGTVMLVVALTIFFSGWQWWADGSLVENLAASGTTAKDSKIFGSHIEIWVVQFVMGVVLMNQPHLLSKALYVEGRRNLTVVIVVSMTVFLVYALVLFAGAYARMIDLGTDVQKDEVVVRYLVEVFAGPWEPLAALVIVAILAASMSTMDGLLVAMSASVSNDFLPGKTTVNTTRIVLVIFGIITIFMSYHPPEDSVILLSQLGVFGFVVASAGPLIAGLYLKGRLPVPVAFVSAGLALAIHFGLTLSKTTQNPGVAACLALAVSVPVALIGSKVYDPSRGQAGSESS